MREMATMLTVFKQERRQIEDRLNSIQLNQQQTTAKLATLEAQAEETRTSTKDIREMFEKMYKRSDALMDVFERAKGTIGLSGAALTPADTSQTHPTRDATTPPEV